MTSFFALRAAKFRFIALRVNSSPVTAGYFFNGPWIVQLLPIHVVNFETYRPIETINKYLQGWLKNAILYLGP